MNPFEETAQLLKEGGSIYEDPLKHLFEIIGGRGIVAVDLHGTLTNEKVTVLRPGANELLEAIGTIGFLPVLWTNAASVDRAIQIGLQLPQIRILCQNYSPIPSELRQFPAYKNVSSLGRLALLIDDLGIMANDQPDRVISVPAYVQETGMFNTPLNVPGIMGEVVTKMRALYQN